MTPKTMVAMVRSLINDEQTTGYTDVTNSTLEAPDGTTELLNYLDRAVDEYSKRQAAAGDLRLLKTISVSSGTTPLPTDYLMLCGASPVNVDNGQVTYYGDEAVMPVRYFARLPYVSDYGEKQTLPYQRDQEITICAMAAIYALNKHEYNVSQDLMLLGFGAASNGSSQQ